MTKILFSVIALLVFASAGYAPPTRATTLARMSLAELARAADTIVQVRCVSAASRWDSGTIWTFTEFEVVETLKGAPQQRISVRVPGGHVGHLAATIEAAPQFRPGEESVLFLEKTNAGDYSVTAWAEGTFRIRRVPGMGRAAVTQESNRFAVFDQATRRFHAEGVRDLSLDEFRQRLTAAMAQPASGISR